MKLIELTQEKFAQVDDADYAHLKEYNWHLATGTRGITGAGRRKDGKTIYMHRQLLNVPQGFEVDHIDGDPLNNQRENLRICTHAENLRNRKVNKNNTSGYKGVRNNHEKWQGYLMFNGKFINLGNFSDKQKAARAYNEAAKVYFGQFARLNEL